MKVRSAKALLVLFVLGLALNTLTAGENLWVYTTGTDTRPQGSWELKLSNVTKMDKGAGSYTLNEFRPEIEYGITDRWTIGVEAIVFDHNYSLEGEDHLAPASDRGKFKSTQLGGFEISTKYNILSPYKDFIGLSLGFSYEYRDVYRLDGSEIVQHSFTPTIYVQKNFLDDTLVVAFKGKLEFEYREGPGVREEELAPDLAIGISYRIAPKWFIGLEARIQSDYLQPEEAGEANSSDATDFANLAKIKVGTQHQYGLYAGPTIHYAEEGWWATAGLLFLVESGGNANSNDSVAHNGKAYDEHERFHLGLTMGFEF